MTAPYIEGNVLYGADDLVAAFVRCRIMQSAEQSGSVCAALGVVRGGDLLGGVLFSDYAGHDIAVTCAFDSPKWATARILKALFHYPFRQLGVVRLTAIIGSENERACSLAERLGFTLEGVIRKAVDGKQDTMVFGMLSDECRWLPAAAERELELAS